jgi:hypothetical protein
MTLDECKSLALASGVKPEYVRRAMDWGVQWEEAIRDYGGDEVLCFWDGLMQVAPGRQTWVLCCEKYIAHAEAHPEAGGHRRAARLDSRRETLADLKSWE